MVHVDACDDIYHGTFMCLLNFDGIEQYLFVHI
jgi:hypothetical protein